MAGLFQCFDAQLTYTSIVNFASALQARGVCFDLSMEKLS